MATTVKRTLGRLAWVVLIAGAVALMVGALARPAVPDTATSGTQSEHAGRVEKIAGSSVGRVILTSHAANRLGIQTVPMREQAPAADPATAPGQPQKVVPYAAVIYDPKGETWVFTNPEPLVYLRTKITISTVRGDNAILTDGPPAGASIVTVGAAELYGTELGVGH